MVKKIRKKVRESPEKENNNSKMPENELKLMVEDLTHLVNDNPKHKLFISILHLFKNKDYSTLDYNEIYDYLLIDTKINPLKYSNQEQPEENKPELKARLDLIMNKNGSFKIVNKGRKKTIELNLIKTKEYLDSIIHGSELKNDNIIEEKKETEEIEEKMNNGEDDEKGEKENENKDEKVKDKEKENIQEKKKENLKEEEEKEKKMDEEKKVEVEKEDDNEENQKKRGRKKKSKRGKQLDFVINLDKKKEEVKKKRKRRENKKKEKEKENGKQINKDNDKNEENKINEEEKKDDNRMDIEKDNKNNNLNEKIENKTDDDNKKENDDDIDIFSKKLYHEFFDESEENYLILNIQTKIDTTLKQISKTKEDLVLIESKLKLFNWKMTEMNLNKYQYDKRKILIDESQKELYNIYLIMMNELNSMKILLNINKYNKEIYDIHKNTLDKYKDNYVEALQKLSKDIKELKTFETEIINNKKQIKDYIMAINTIYKKVLDNIQIDILDEKKEINIINKEENDDISGYINVDLTLDTFNHKKDGIIEQIQKMEENNQKNY